MSADDIARGEAIIRSGIYVPPQGEYLGRIEYWGLDVYDNSPQQWQEALRAEQEQ